MKTLSTLFLLIASIKVGNPCMSTENPYDTTTTTTTTSTTPAACSTCDLASLYSTTFCPETTGCQYHYPLVQGAQVINSTRPPCTEVRNICPPNAFVGVALETEGFFIPTADFDATLQIECNPAGDWIALVNDPIIGGIHNINQLTCFTQKNCATCDATVVNPDIAICAPLNIECVEPDYIISQYNATVGCSTLVIQCLGNTVLGLEDGQSIEMTAAVDAVSEVTCENGSYKMYGPTATAGIPIKTAACRPA